MSYQKIQIITNKSPSPLKKNSQSLNNLKIIKPQSKYSYSDVSPPPSKFTIKYNSHEIHLIEILEIYEQIKAKIIYMDSKLKSERNPQIQRKKEEIEKELETKLTKSRREYLLQTLNLYKDDVKESLSDYLKLTKPLIDEYHKILPENKEEKVEIIKKLIKIFSQFVDVQILPQEENINQDDQCPHCLKKYTFDNNIFEGVRKCSSCNLEDLSFNKLCNKEIIPSGLVTKTKTYKTNDQNIMKSFRNYCGFQKPNKLPPNLEEELDSYFTSPAIGRKKGSYYRNLEPDISSGYTGDTNHDMLFEALKALKFKNHYEDANLIGHKYWGWRLPNAGHLEEDFRIIYNIMYDVYIQIPKKRLSNLNTEFIKYNILRILGHSCFPYQFRLPKEDDSQKENEELYEKICEIAQHKDSRIKYFRTFN